MGKVGCILYLMALLVGCLGGSFLKFDLAGAAKKKKGNFRFLIEGDACRVSLCFRYLYIADILWNNIQGSLLSL